MPTAMEYIIEKHYQQLKDPTIEKLFLKVTGFDNGILAIEVVKLGDKEKG